MTGTETPVKHQIRWFVHCGGEMIPREKTMRGTWGHDAKCSCGWESRTGGAVRSFVQAAVDEHKWDVEHGFWKAGE